MGINRINLYKLRPKDKLNHIQDVVAVKVIRSVKKYVDSATVEAEFLSSLNRNLDELLTSTDETDEIKLLRQEYNYRNHSWCLKLINHFLYQDHYCLVSEALGLSLYNVIKSNSYKGFSLKNTLNICRQLFGALLFLEVCCQIVHTDLKLENILFVNDAKIVQLLHDVKNGNKPTTIGENFNESDLIIKLIDFGGAYKMRETNSSTKTQRKFCHRYSGVNTRQYRSPEVTLETGWSFPSDIWSAGCIAFEIYSGDLLFQTHDESEHLALMEKILKDNFSRYRSLIRRSPRRREFFRSSYDLRWPPPSHYKRSNVKFVEKTKTLERKIRNKAEDDCNQENLDRFTSLLKGTLEINPSERITALEAIEITKKMLKNMN